MRGPLNRGPLKLPMKVLLPLQLPRLRTRGFESFNTFSHDIYLTLNAPR